MAIKCASDAARIGTKGGVTMKVLVALEFGHGLDQMLELVLAVK